MDFAKRQLQKYGWTEGSGLGKNETGIAEPIKPKLKFDTAGIGHDVSEQFTNNWWEHLYNNAANNVNIVNSESGAVNVTLNSEESVNITTKKFGIKSSDKSKLEYGSFLKSSTLTAEGMVDFDDKMIIDEEPAQSLNAKILTDEELLEACDGRTAHKGARHGLKLNGKLSRIAAQERQLLLKLHNVSTDLQAKCASMDTADDYEAVIANTKTSRKCKIKKYDSDENLEYKKRKKSKKRCYSDDEQDLAENIRSKSTHKKQKQEKKKLTSIANMFENVCVIDPQENNRDDGFDESSKGDFKEDKELRKKMKKAKKNKEINKSSEDDGFEECIKEVSEKLIYMKELRKDLLIQKHKGDEQRISKMSEDFEAKL